MIKYELNRDLKILKDGHVMFMEDVLTDLKRKSFLENESIVKTARIDEIIKFIFDECLELDDRLPHRNKDFLKAIKMLENLKKSV